jgi:hypothetical protein
MKTVGVDVKETVFIHWVDPVDLIFGKCFVFPPGGGGRRSPPQDQILVFPFKSLSSLSELIDRYSLTRGQTWKPPGNTLETPCLHQVQPAVYCK